MVVDADPRPVGSARPGPGELTPRSTVHERATASSGSGAAGLALIAYRRVRERERDARPSVTFPVVTARATVRG